MQVRYPRRHAHALFIDARTLEGEYIRAMPKNEGGRPKTGGKNPPVSSAPSLAEQGIDKDEAKEARALATLKAGAPFPSAVVVFRNAQTGVETVTKRGVA
jgi:hypothetical protein